MAEISIKVDESILKTLENLGNIKTLKSDIDLLLNNSNIALEEAKKIKNETEIIINEKTKGFPWLSDAFGQYLELKDLKLADYLDAKKTPAHTAAENVRKIAAQKRTLVKQLKETRNIIRYYESLFPWIVEYVGEDVDEVIKMIYENDNRVDDNGEEEDPVMKYMSKAEYQKLSVSERNQKALDRYFSTKKTSWQIGRDYERYIGYLYLQEGYEVQFHGIEEGLADLGRDLIAVKKDETKIIQCKYWAKHKTIHEKHIAQLFGTTLKYWIEQNPSKESKKKNMQRIFEATKSNKINGVFITSTKLSEIAKKFADQLGVEVKENFELKPYPCIKCNISKKTDEKIYHLPMDQQYDNVLVEPKKGEFYATTVAEAEDKGFRRAYKWKSNNKD